MGNLFSKLLGRTTINFNSENIKQIFLHDSAPSLSNHLQNEVRSLKEGSNHIYSCLIGHHETKGYIKLRFIPGGDKPHQAVWLNFSNIVNEIIKKTGKSENEELTLLRKIFDNNEKKFPLPSKLRNDWNYSDQKYFTDLGSMEAKRFLQILKNRTALDTWVKEQSSFRTLSVNHSSPENKVCSLAFVYTVFLDVFTELTQALDMAENHEKIRIRLNKRKNRPNRKR